MSKDKSKYLRPMWGADGLDEEHCVKSVFARLTLPARHSDAGNLVDLGAASDPILRRVWPETFDRPKPPRIQDAEAVTAWELAQAGTDLIPRQ